MYEESIELDADGAVVCGLGLSVSSCSDDDDGKPYILRLITTRRPDDKEEHLETLHFDFQTRYPSDQTRLMSPTDTYSQTLVDQYATTDPWPLCKWLMSDCHREHTEEADEFYHRFDDFAFGDADNTGVQDLRQAYFYLKPSSGYRKKTIATTAKSYIPMAASQTSVAPPYFSVAPL